MERIMTEYGPAILDNGKVYEPGEDSRYASGFKCYGCGEIIWDTPPKKSRGMMLCRECEQPPIRHIKPRLGVVPAHMRDMINAETGVAA